MVQSCPARVKVPRVSTFELWCPSNQSALHCQLALATVRQSRQRDKCLQQRWQTRQEKEHEVLSWLHCDQQQNSLRCGGVRYAEGSTSTMIHLTFVRPKQNCYNPQLTFPHSSFLSPRPLPFTSPSPPTLPPHFLALSSRHIACFLSPAVLRLTYTSPLTS